MKNITTTKRTSFKKKRIVVFGTFDILHIGHLQFFKEAKTQTDPKGKLIVVVARDKNVRQMKHKDPVYNEKERVLMVAALEIVDEAVLGKRTGSKFDILAEIKPDYIVLGYDQWVSENKLAEELQKRNLEHTQIIRLNKYGSTDLNSSSKVIKRVFKLYEDQ